MSTTRMLEIEEPESEYRGGLSRRHLLQGALVAGGGLALSLAPMTAAEAQLVARPSAEQQRQVGQEAAKKILTQYRAVNDGRARFYENLGRRLVSALPAAERQKWAWGFTVLESDEVNAFALPGGPTFLFTGLFKRLQTEDALAAVTAHEIAHVAKEHWAKQATKAQERQALLSIGVALLKGKREAVAVAQLADTAIGLKYSRGDEDESDAAGLNYMVGARYNPNGMVQLLTTLQKLGGGGKSLVGDFLSDHPLTSDRIRKTQERINRLRTARTFPAMRPLRYNSLA
jgi:beta-barrel assembly-enhancing protease